MEPIPEASLLFSKEKFGKILEELHKRELNQEQIDENVEKQNSDKIETNEVKEKNFEKEENFNSNLEIHENEKKCDVENDIDSDSKSENDRECDNERENYCQNDSENYIECDNENKVNQLYNNHEIQDKYDNEIINYHQQNQNVIYNEQNNQINQDNDNFNIKNEDYEQENKSQNETNDFNISQYEFENENHTIDQEQFGTSNFNHEDREQSNIESSSTSSDNENNENDQKLENNLLDLKEYLPYEYTDSLEKSSISDDESNQNKVSNQIIDKFQDLSQSTQHLNKQDSPNHKSEINGNITSSPNINDSSIFKIENRYFLACSLVRSQNDSDIHDGILLLQEILQTNWNKKEVLFHLCLGNYKRRNLVQAKILCQKLLLAYPLYKNGMDMLKLFEYEVQELRKNRRTMVTGQGYSSLVASSPVAQSKGVDRFIDTQSMVNGMSFNIESVTCPKEYKEILRKFTEEEISHLIACFMKISEDNNILGVFDKEQFGENLSILKFNDFVYTHVFEFFKQTGSLLDGKGVDLGSSFEDSSNTVNFSQFILTMAILLNGTQEMQLSLAFDAMNAREKKGYISESDIQYYVDMIIEMLHYLSLETIPSDKITKYIIKELKDDSNIYRFSKEETPDIRITKEDFITNGNKNYGRIVGLGILIKSSTSKDNEFLRRGVHSICGSRRFKDVLNIMTGIRLAIEMFKPLHREILPIDFSTSAQFSIIHTKGSINQFNDYAPRVFKKLRSIFQIKEIDFIMSTAPEMFFGKLLFGAWSSLSETQSDGRSGAYFYYTHDGKYIIKNIPQAESLALRRTLSTYYNHVKTYKSSFLVKYLNLFDYNKKSYCIMMNAFSTNREIHEIYDIKGSVVARSNPDGRVKKDNDLKHVLDIGKEKRDRILRVLWCDIDSLLNLKFTDYSLLVGIHFIDGPPTQSNEAQQDENESSFNRGPLTQIEQRSILEKEQQNLYQGDLIFDLSDIVEQDGGIYSNDRKQIYYFSIIDTLTEYTWTKSAERSIKTFKYGAKRRNQISSQPPEDYALRLKAFIAKILK